MLISAFPGAPLAVRGIAASDGTYVGFIGLLVLIGCHAARFAGGGHLPGAILGLLSGFTAGMHNHSRLGLRDFDEPLFWSLPAFGVACFALAHLVHRRGSRGSLAASLSAMATFVALPALMEAIGRVSRAPVSGLLLAVAAAGTMALVIAWPIRERDSRSAPGLRYLALALASFGIALLLTNLTKSAGRPFGHAYLRPFHPAVSFVALAAMLGALPLAASIRARRTFRSSDPVRPFLAIGTRTSSWITALPLLSLLTAPGPLGAMLWAAGHGDPTAAEWFLSGPLRQSLLVGGALLAAMMGVFVDRVDRPSGVGPFAVAATLAAAALGREVSAHATLVTAALASGTIALLLARAALGPLVQLASIAVLVPLVGLLFFTFVAGAFRATDALLPLQLTVDFGLVLAAAWASYAALGRVQSREEEHSEPVAALRYATGAGILALLFGWMNAAVLNQFTAPGESIRLVNERLQARDLSLSISWGLFASGLLALGMVRRSAVLRWTSLCLFLAFVLKVFLYDLGALTGLSRVGSFLGLAVALLGVSLLYARVLGTGAAEVDNLPDHDAA